MMAKPEDYDRIQGMIRSAENLEDHLRNVLNTLNEAEDELDSARSALREAEAKFNTARGQFRWALKAIAVHRDLVQGKKVDEDALGYVP